MRYQRTAGGGVVKATVKGSNELVSVEIAADVIDPSDPEMLQELEDVESMRPIDLFLAHVALVTDIDQHDAVVTDLPGQLRRGAPLVCPGVGRVLVLVGPGQAGPFGE